MRDFRPRTRSPPFLKGANLNRLVAAGEGITSQACEAMAWEAVSIVVAIAMELTLSCPSALSLHHPL